MSYFYYRFGRCFSSSSRSSGRMGGGDGNAKIDAWLGLLLARDKKQTPNYTLLLCVFILLTLVRTAELASSTPSSSVALFIPSFTHVTCTHTHKSYFFWPQSFAWQGHTARRV